ncbi:MAG TPA: HAD family phosphatase [Candidatus Baltobacteraceae bacterium]|nr:HAD family phosphatase [Candidatus Baltobacteraceae bacterium]
MIKLLIFDIGGVIIKFREIDYVKYIAKKHNFRVYEFARALFPLIDQMELGELRLKDLEDRMSSEFGIKNSGLEWDSAYERLAKVDKDTRALITKLSKTYKVVLLSNVSETRYDVLKRVLIRHLNVRAFASCYLHMRKPDPKIYRYVLSKMGAKPSEAVFVDDLIPNVRGARRVGIAAIQFKSAAQVARELRKHDVTV